MKSERPTNALELYWTQRYFQDAHCDENDFTVVLVSGEEKDGVEKLEGFSAISFASFKSISSK